MTGIRATTFYGSGSRATVYLVGEIDADTAPTVGAAVQDCLRRVTDGVDIELTGVSFCDASGLNVFLAAALDAAAGGRRIRLRHATPAVHRLFDLTGTASLLDAVRTGASVPPSGSARRYPRAGAAGGLR
ncbi:STAS domain-containing protein [Streptomyces maremycinicus]|uniref:STAS domain-containing protein n=1 Tax=Streptomyces maremycinicus TaxID=1679753 RepID=UPI0007C8244D|nr:STAS domain-containing protein [Streptomyces sp. NBRC 110468]